jgi:hypothetical protein
VGGDLEAIMARLAAASQPAVHPTAQSAVASLPRRKVPAADADPAVLQPDEHAACKAGEPCSVCHDEFGAGEEVLQLPCLHCFHGGCIKPWLDEVGGCWRETPRALRCWQRCRACATTAARLPQPPVLAGDAQLASMLAGWLSLAGPLRWSAACNSALAPLAASCCLRLQKQRRVPGICRGWARGPAAAAYY